MTSLDAQIRAGVAKAMLRLNVTASFSVITRTVNKATGAVTEGADSPVTVRSSPLLEYKAAYKSPDNEKIFRSYIITEGVDTSGNEWEPKIGQKVAVSGQTLRVGSITTHRASAQVVAYEVRLESG